MNDCNSFFIGFSLLPIVIQKQILLILAYRKQFMPRQLKILVVLLFAVLFAKAQGFDAGFLGGINGAQVDGDQMDGYNKPGPVFGLLSSQRYNNHWSSQFEMLYIQKGAKSKPDSTGTQPFYRLRLNYIEVPVLLRYHFGSKFQYLAEAGLGFARLLSYREQVDYVDYTNADFHKTDYALNLGFAYALTDRLLFRVRYDYSFLPIRNNTFVSRVGRRAFFGYGQFNNVLQFTLSYNLRSIKPAQP